MKYVEYAPFNVNGRNQCASLDTINDIARKVMSFNAAFFVSIYEYDETVVEHFRLKRTIRGYNGVRHLPQITLDVDKGTNSDKFIFDEVVMRVKEMLQKYEWFADNHIVWYSGTGYHIVIPEVFGFEDSATLPDIVKQTMKQEFPWVDNIFDGSRILRAGGSRNEKVQTNRYKTKIPTVVLLDEATVCEDIIAMASVPSVIPFTYETLSIEEAPLHSRIKRPPLTFKGGIPQKAVTPPSAVVSCMQSIYNEGEKIGSRHERLLRLSSWQRRAGIPLQLAIQSLCSYAPSLDPLEVERIVTGTYEKGYSYGCEDSLLQRYCSEKCNHYSKKSYSLQMADAYAMEAQFTKFINSEYGDKVIDLANYYNMHTYKLFPGELVVLIGDTKLGKSAWFQNLSVLIAPKKVIYFSLEVHQDLMFRRMLQIAHKKTKEDINAHYKQEAPISLIEPVSHVLMSTHSPKLSDIVKTIVEYAPNVVIIDTLDMVDAEVADPIQQVEVCAKRLKDIAQKHNIIIMVVHHIAKANAIDEDGRQKALTIHSGKYATALQQKADKVLGIEGVRGQPRRVIRSLGSRDETDFKLTFDVDWNTFIFNQVAS